MPEYDPLLEDEEEANQRLLDCFRGMARGEPVGKTLAEERRDKAYKALIQRCEESADPEVRAAVWEYQYRANVVNMLADIQRAKSKAADGSPQTPEDR